MCQLYSSGVNEWTYINIKEVLLKKSMLVYQSLFPWVEVKLVCCLYWQVPHETQEEGSTKGQIGGSRLFRGRATKLRAVFVCLIVTMLYNKMLNMNMTGVMSFFLWLSWLKCSFATNHDVVVNSLLHQGWSCYCTTTILCVGMYFTFIIAAKSTVILCKSVIFYDSVSILFIILTSVGKTGGLCLNQFFAG